MAENRYTPADWMAALPDLKKVGNEHTGPCPVCGGTDRFRVNAKGAFCRHECSPYPDLCKAVFGDTSASAPSTEKCWTCHSPGGDTAVHVRLDTPGKSKRVWWKEKPPQFTTKDFLYFPPGADREGAAAVICEGRKGCGCRGIGTARSSSHRHRNRRSNGTEGGHVGLGAD